MNQEEMEAKIKELENKIFDLEMNMAIKNKRIDRMSCRIDNIEKAYTKHLNSFHSGDSG